MSAALDRLRESLLEEAKDPAAAGARTAIVLIDLLQSQRAAHAASIEKQAELVRGLDEARGKLALIVDAYWLAFADLPHAEDCTLELCGHRPYIECPHIDVDCTCPEPACECACSCWRSAADKVDDVDEALKLCTQLRDREDELEAVVAERDRLKLMLEAAESPPFTRRRLRAESARKDTALELILAQVVAAAEEPAVSLQSIASIARAALAPHGGGS